MSKSKKITLAAILLVAAGAAIALAAVGWAGTGTGSCTLNTTGPAAKVIYPWQRWSGTIQGSAFYGTWTDKLGNRGTFKGTMGISIPEVGIAKGAWTFGSTNMGTFEMKFDMIKGTCTGTWKGTSSYTSQCSGTMTGKKT